MMASCLLCLKKCVKRIKLGSKKGKDLECSLIIAQHFWIKPKAEKSSDDWVCLPCWDVLLAFHELYQTVAKAHNYFECKVSEDFFNAEEIKLEEDNLKSLQVDAGNQVPELIENDSDNLFEPQLEENYHTKLESIEICANNHTDNDSEAEIPLSMLKLNNIQEIAKNLKNDLMAGDGMELNESTQVETQQTDVEENFDNDFQLYDEQYFSENESKNAFFKNDSDFHTDSGSDYIPMEENAETKNIKSVKSTAEYDENIAKLFKKLECFICKLLFQKFDDLSQHSVAIHNRYPTVICCGRSFHKPNTLSSHVAIHLNAHHLQCSHCNQVFYNDDILEHHIKNNHQCNKCTEVFPNKKELQQHLQKIHSVLLPAHELACPECHREFSTRRKLYEHKRSAHGDKVACELCGMQFNYRGSLHRHMLYHRNYKCDHCTEAFSSKKKLKEHQLVVHSIKTDCEFVCPQCDKKFATKRKLYEHKRSVHAAQSICDICGKHLNSRASFYFHMRKHQDAPVAAQDPVECDICGKVIKYRNNLKQHKEWVHGNRFEYECPICKKVSASKHALDGHIKRMHNEQSSFPCTMCEKVFKSKFDLREHINTHTKEKQFPCGICSKIFFRRATLQRHERKVHCVGSSMLATIKFEEPNCLQGSIMET